MSSQLNQPTPGASILTECRSNSSSGDALHNLVRLLARQAARECYGVAKAALLSDAPPPHPIPSSDGYSS